MIYQYPKSIQTIIEAEQIVDNENLFLYDTVIERIVNDRKYVIYFVINRIRACLVFDLNDNLIDHYNAGASYFEPMYKDKLYYQYIT